MAKSKFPAPLDEPRYSIQETARLLGQRVSTIYNWKSLGKIRAFKVGRAVLFPQSEIDRILEAGWTYTAEATR